MRAPSKFQHRLLQKFLRFSAFASLLVILVAALVLIGWGLDIVMLKRILPGFESMKVNTALGFILLATALWLQMVQFRSKLQFRLISYACALLAALIGALSLAQYLFDINLGIDNLLFQDRSLPTSINPPGRMGHLTALYLLTIGASVWLLSFHSRRVVLAAQFLALVGIMTGLMALAGYLYDVRELYDVFTFSTVALHSSILFILLGFGVLAARPNEGMMRVISDEHYGGYIARRLLPLGFVLPLVLAWLVLKGERLGWYGHDLRLALFATCSVLIISAVVWWTARTLNLLDARRRIMELEALAADKEMGELQIFSDTMIDALPGILYFYDDQGQFLRWNKNFETASGYSGKEIAKMHPLDFFSGDEKALLGNRIAEVFKQGTSSVEASFLSKDGKLTPYYFTGRKVVYNGTDCLVGMGIDNTDRKHAEDLVLKSSNQMQIFIEQSPVSIAMFDRDMKYLAASQLWWLEHQREHESMIGHSHYDVFPNLPNKWKRAHQQGLAGAMLSSDEDYWPYEDGAERWISWKVAPWQNNDGLIGGIIITTNNVTEHKLATDVIRKYATIFENAGWGMVIVEPETQRFTHLNSAFAKMHGYTAEEMMTMNLADTFAQAAKGELDAHIEAANKYGHYVYESMHIRKDGSIFPCLTDVTAFKDETGRLLFRAATFEDISKRKQAELELLESEQKLRKVMDGLGPNNFVGLLLPDGTVVEANLPALEIAGLRLKDVVGRRVEQTPWFSYSKEVQKTLRTAVAQAAAGEGCRFDIQIRAANGGLVWVDLSIHPYRNEHGNIIYLVPSATVIEKRKQAEEQLQKSEARMRAILDTAMDAVIGMDTKGRITDWNPRAEVIFGWHKDEVVGLKLADTIIPKQHRKAHTEGLAKFLATEEGPIMNRRIEITALRRSGEEFPVELTVAGFKTDDAYQFSAFVADISTRKRLERERLQAQQDLRNTVDSIDGIVWEADIQTFQFSFVSEQAERILGYPTADWLETPTFWKDHILEEDRDAAVTGCIAATNAMQAHQLEYRMAAADGRIVWLRDNISVIFEDGRPIKLCGILVDITNSKIAEIETQRLNRALLMLSACNYALVHITDEKELLDNISQLIVEKGGYRMAWVGYAQHDVGRTVTPMSRAGVGAGYLDEMDISWAEDRPEGRRPTGKVIRSGEPVVLENIEKNDAEFYELIKASEHNFQSYICLPLSDKSHVFGVLGLYSGEVHEASDKEMALLKELADDLAFGITKIQAELEHQKIRSTVATIGVSVSTKSRDEFFQQLVLNMAEALGAEAAFLARLLPGEPLRARTIAAVVDGEVIENMEYVIAGTPCENLVSAESFVVLDDVVKCFPYAPTLKALDMHAYVGRQLLDSSGKAVGQLFVLYRKPLKEAEFVISILQIFAARAAGELERQITSAHVRDQASLLDQAQDAIIVRGLDHVIQFWNKGAERLYGWTSSEAVGVTSQKLLREDPVQFKKSVKEFAKHGEWSGEITQQTKDGSPLTVVAHWNIIKDEAGQHDSILTINTDISERKAAEERIEHLAFYDSLTGLANRLLLVARLQQALATSARHQRMGALLFIDLDNFKLLNDTLGHDMGDLLLQQVAHRVVDCVRDSDTVARLGGDEFVVMLEDLSEALPEATTQAKIVGEKILASFDLPFQLTGVEHHSTPSIGISLFGDQANSVEELLKRADIAMYQAKASGRNAMRFFDPEMQAVISARVNLEADLHEALQQSEFILHYQPQVNSKGRVLGAEALVRWQHPKLGMIPPVKFIPLAEDTGLIMLLGHWVLETACNQLTIWAKNPKTAELTLSVNVSARQFLQTDFVEQVLAVIDYAGCNPERLKLELTESMLVESAEDIIAKMKSLKVRGVGFSLDDFGTGYSSLVYLKRLPLDQLKIDQAFVRDLLTNPNDAAIAHTVISLGQNLGLTVIAEGVETVEQQDFLAKYGCNAYQGYLFSKPLPIEQFTEYLAATNKERRAPKK